MKMTILILGVALMIAGLGLIGFSLSPLLEDAGNRLRARSADDWIVLEANDIAHRRLGRLCFFAGLGLAIIGGTSITAWLAKRSPR